MIDALGAAEIGRCVPRYLPPVRRRCGHHRSGPVDDLLSEADERFGLERLACLHVNDSAMPLGSNRDRHANVGAGLIGAGMATILGHPRLQQQPAVMETAGAGDGPDAEQMAAIRRLHRNGVRRWARRA